MTTEIININEWERKQNLAIKEAKENYRIFKDLTNKLIKEKQMKWNERNSNANEIKLSSLFSKKYDVEK